MLDTEEDRIGEVENLCKQYSTSLVREQCEKSTIFAQSRRFTSALAEFIQVISALGSISLKFPFLLQGMTGRTVAAKKSQGSMFSGVALHAALKSLEL